MSLIRRRRGLTRVELLGVLAGVALVCAILTPVILASREDARKNGCKDKLKQIGLALHSYHDTHKTFPPGFVIGANDVYHGWSWSVFIVPYLDDNPWYSDIQFGSGLQAESLKPNLHLRLPSFRCPADLGSEVVSSVSMVTTDVVDWTVTPGTTNVTNKFSRSNYFGSAGYLHDFAGGIEASDPWKTSYASSDTLLNPGSLGAAATKYSRYHRYVDQLNFGGIFGQNSRIEIRDVHDGTTNTFMVGERYSPRASVNREPVIGEGGWLGVPDPTTAAGLAMSLGDTSIAMKLNINGRSTTGFGSNHDRGANLLFADGHVVFVSEKLDLFMYRMMSGIDDGIPKSCGF